VDGSAYRRPDARMLFTTGRVLTGSISNGCLEANVVRSGPWLASRGPKVRRYEAASDDERPTGSGCGGTIDVLIEQDCGVEPADPVTFIEHCLAEERRGVMATVYRSTLSSSAVGARLCWELGQAPSSTIKNPAVEAVLLRVAEELLRGPRVSSRNVAVGESVDALLEVIEPPPHLFIFGTGADVLPVLEFATSIGWNTTVCANKHRPTTGDRFARHTRLLLGEAKACVDALDRCLHPLALVMSHDFQADTRALSALLGSRSEYIGVLGPARRLERLLDELPALPPFNRLAAVHGPAGLDLGAETPAEIALSIVSEAQAALRRTDAESLRDRARAPEAPLDPGSGVHLQHPDWCANDATRRGA
ncbi:MAG TPA: XdhC family protein, partial [Polyangiaceae bacterium]